MTFIEEYLNCLTEANAYTKRAAAGTLSKDAVNRLRDAGTVRPLEKYKAGYAKGTNNIIKRTGYEIEGVITSKHPPKRSIFDDDKVYEVQKRQDMFKTNGPFTHAPSRKIVLGDKINNEITKRHEANEASALEKRKHLNREYNSQVIHTHSTPKILKNEEKDTNTIKTLYGNEKNDPLVYQARMANIVRKATGEYNDVKNLTNTEYKKLHRYHPSKHGKRLIGKVKAELKTRELPYHKSKIGLRQRILDLNQTI